MTDARRDEGTEIDPTAVGICEVIEEKISEAQTNTPILSGGLQIMSQDTSTPTQVSGWGTDTEGHIGRIKPYCL